MRERICMIFDSDCHSTTWFSHTKSSEATAFDCPHLWSNCRMLRTWHWSVPIIVGTLQCHVLNMPVVFHQLFIQSGTTWWKITTRFTSLKTKACFLKPSCFLTAVQTFWKIDCTSMILSFKDTFDMFCCKMHSRRCHHSLMPARLCHASLHYPLTSTVHCCWSRPWTASLSSRLSMHRCCWVYSAIVGSAQHLMLKWL